MNRPHGERDQHDQDGNTIAVINFDEMPYPEYWRRHDVVTFSALPQYAILSGNCWQMASGSTWCYLRQKITPVWWDWRIPTKDGTSYYYQKLIVYRWKSFKMIAYVGILGAPNYRGYGAKRSKITIGQR